MAETTNESPKSIEARQRNVYLAERIRALRAEIKELTEERRTVRETLRGGVERGTPEAKALRGRRIYLSVRPAEAREELQRAQEERKALNAA